MVGIHCRLNVKKNLRRPRTFCVFSAPFQSNMCVLATPCVTTGKGRTNAPHQVGAVLALGLSTRAGEGIAASNPPGHRWRRASGCTRSRHRPGRGQQQPHQVNTTAPPDPGPGPCLPVSPYRTAAPAGAGVWVGLFRRFNAPNACTALRVAPGMLPALDRR